MTNENESFFQEVEERVRQDKVLTQLKKYGPWLVGALALGLVALGGWTGYQEWRINSARQQSVPFSEAQAQLRSGDLDGAKAAFAELSSQGPQVYRAMAQMEHAAILQAQGDYPGAIAGFDAAAEASPDPVMRDTARLRAAYLVAETQDFEALQTRLQPMIDGETPFSYAARELLGVEAWEAGNLDLARDTLEPLTLAFDAPESVRQRAQLALAVIGPSPASAAPAASPAPEAAAPAGESQ